MKRNFNENSSSSFSIEKQINSIFKGLVANLPQNLVAVRSRPRKDSSLCKGLIQVFERDVTGEKADEIKKNVQPKETYAFYMKDFQDSELESIAIYGEEVTSKYYSLKRKGYLFGYKIASLKIESGLRPFLDVKLAVSR